MNYRIVSDSSANVLSHSDPHFVCVPMKVRAAKEYVDDLELDLAMMVEDLKKHNGPSGSSCPSVGEYLEAFGEAEEVFCITITSNLSGSYNAAAIAAQTYREQHPERNVFVFDSLSTGPEMILLAQRIRQMLAQKLPFQQIVERGKAYLEKTRLAFSLESLNNLANNGRVPGAVAKLAGILSIRLTGIAYDGRLKPVGKARGEKKVGPELMRILADQGYAGGRVLINHCLNQSGAENLRRLILEKFPTAEVAIGTTGGLCSFYAEQGGLLVGFETGC